MQVVFSLSQLQYFHKAPFAPIFHLNPYLIFTATLKSIIPESLVLVTNNEQFGVKSAHIRTTKRRYIVILTDLPNAINKMLGKI